MPCLNYSAVLTALICLLNLTVFGAPIAMAGASDEISPPAGLKADEWQDIQNQVFAAQYHAHQSDGGFEASNHAHGLHAQFGEDGSTAIDTGAASIQFRLVSANRQPQSISIEKNTVTYQWNNNIREWWVNDENGLEQWFEIAERPSNNQPLALNIDLQTTLDVSRSNNQLLFSDENIALTYDKLLAWDATGLELSSHMSLEGSQLTLHVDDSNAQYPITIDPTLSQQAYVKASNTGTNDAFGFSLALDGDTLVVGATSESSSATGVNGDEADNSALFSGAAYVFTRSGMSWTQQAYLKASNTDASDGFGASVDISNDTIVVGASGESSAATGVGGDQSDNTASRSGAAYVFTRTGSNWSQQAYIKASNTDPGDRFGRQVALDGDILAVGAVPEASNATGVNGDETDNSALSSGAVYIFTRSGSNWSQQAYLKASNSEAGDQFGWDVDVDGETVVVAAFVEDSSATGINGNEADNSAFQAGAVYVFTQSGTNWTQQAYIKASNTGVNDQFGYSLALEEDTLVVGARGEDSNATGVGGDQTNNLASFSGAAYVFTRTGTTWSQQEYLKASNTDSTDFFGEAVALYGNTILIGAPSEDSNAVGVDGNQADNSVFSSGATYLFTRSGTTWSQQAYLKASNTEAVDQFSFSMAVSDDAVVVGARLEDSNATGFDGNQADNSAENSGAAYIFNIEPDQQRRIIVTGN